MTKSYLSLAKNIFTYNEAIFSPIRFSDRYKIMDWRNSQIFHLRQAALLTYDEQDQYFTNIVKPLLSSKKPKQYLFSYDYSGKFTGYGGLVHIDYELKAAELSFLVNPALGEDFEQLSWDIYLQFAQELAFKQVGLSSISGYCYDTRSWLYPIYEKYNFQRKFEGSKFHKSDKAEVVIYEKENIL